jgi:hypothetical protein
MTVRSSTRLQRLEGPPGVVSPGALKVRSPAGQPELFMSSIHRHPGQLGAGSALRSCVVGAMLLCMATLAACGGGGAKADLAAAAPTITTQPDNQTVTVGETATFTTVASGTAPLSYQWSMNGSAIAGATSPSYTTAATTLSDSGATFSVQVSNEAGSTTSTPATLTVTATPVAPVITTQPKDQSVTVGASATFTVVASGTTPLTYQWAKGGSVITGATGASYTTPATVIGDSGSTFSVEVSNAAGNITSSTATLTVSAAAVAPTITTQPQNQSVTVGATATFTIVASGTAPLTYQWSKSGSAITGATSASYTTPATVIGDNGATFSVEVSNAAGNITSTSATLTVSAVAVAPTITTQPQNQSVIAGATATFTVVAAGTAPLTYQWSKGGSVITGATSASYTTPATAIGDSGSTFTVKVSNSAGSATSIAATLTVTAAATPPTITTQPQNRSVSAGATATFSVVASGTAPLSYQWSKNASAIAGATSASYTTPATVTGDNGSAFTVQVSNGAGSITSNAAILTVTTTAVAPTITTQPLDQSVTVGGTATFIVVASGTAPLTYQWSENGSVITGATSASYTTPAVSIGDSGSTFSVKVSNSAGSATSNAASLTVTATSGAPVMFQHIASSTNPVGNGISGHNFTFHTESLPPNTVAVMGVSAPSGKTVSISDSLAGSWSSAICTAGAAADETAWVFVQSLGATGGPDAININVGSSDTQPVQYVITFWQNISTSAPANGSLCAGSLMPGAGGVINPGAFTPATNNDVNGGNLIWSYTPLCTGYAASNPSKWVPGAGFSLLNGEIGWASNQGFPDASQYLLQTASAAVTPSITATGDTADCFNSASVALKVANNSAAVPSTIHVASILHETPFGYSGATMTVQTPTVGNLRVIGFPWEGGSPGGAGPAVQSVSSSDNCSWTVIGETNGAAVQAYAQNCTPCPNCTTSVTMSGSGANQGSFRFYDIQNAQSSSYQNSTGNSGSCGAPVAANMPGNFTPTGANSGLTIATNGNGQGPLTGLAAGSPAGTFDLWTYTDQTDSDLADNADGQAHFYYSSKATQTWNWTKVTAGDVCYWWASNYN